MGRTGTKLCMIAALLSLFSITSCKPTKSRLKLFGRTSTCDGFNIATDMFSTAVRECFQNDRKHYYEGMKYNIIEAQQIMGSYFGYSAYGFR